MMTMYINELSECIKEAEKNIERLPDAKSILAQCKIEVYAERDATRRKSQQECIKKYENEINRLELLSKNKDTPIGTKFPKDIESMGLERLQECVRQLDESEEIGKATLANLKVQGEALHRIHDNLKVVQDELSVSQKFLNRMGKWWRR